MIKKTKFCPCCLTDWTDTPLGVERIDKPNGSENEICVCRDCYAEIGSIVEIKKIVDRNMMKIEQRKT